MTIINHGDIDIVKIDGKWHAARVQSTKWLNLMNDQPMPLGAATPEAALDQLVDEEERHIILREKQEARKRAEAQGSRMAEMKRAEKLLADHKKKLEQIKEMRRLIDNPDIDLRDKELELVDAEIENYHSDIRYLEDVMLEIRRELWTG